MCTHACSHTVGRQTLGLLSCQCPAATPAGLLLLSDTQTHKLTYCSDPQQCVCALNVCSATTQYLCVSIRALNSVQNGGPIGRCQQSSSPRTKAQTHMLTQLSSILPASPVSHLTRSSHFHGSLSLCLRCCPSKISSHVGISQCGTV